MSARCIPWAVRTDLALGCVGLFGYVYLAARENTGGNCVRVLDLWCNGVLWAVPWEAGSKRERFESSWVFWKKGRLVAKYGGFS